METTHVIILPTPGMGHLIPLVEFAKKLHHRHRISSTLLIPSDGPISAAQTLFLSALPAAVSHLLLPPADLSDLPAATKIETRITLTVSRSLPSIRAAVKSLLDGGAAKPAAFVVDLFGTDGFIVAREFQIPPYLLFPSTAMFLSLCFYLPELDETTSCEYRDLPEKIQIPGCIPIHGRDLLDPLQDRSNDAYKWTLHNAKNFRLADGIILNSFQELELNAIESLQRIKNGGNNKPIVYPIGPLIQMGSKSEKKPEKIDDDSSNCLKWLDDQPNGSVLYVSFGSGGVLPHEQIIELALGLEASEQRFLWVVRAPSNTTPDAAYFSVHTSGDPLAYLPDGFLERTKGRGLVVPSWAPQARILAHRSTGGFLTHCGWNSTLESVVSGVPMIAWPLYAEQRMNAVMLHEDIGVALRPKIGENGLVGREEIASVVKGLMEGEEGKGVRGRMRDLEEASREVLGENGSSTKALDDLVAKWKSCQ